MEELIFGILRYLRLHLSLLIKGVPTTFVTYLLEALHVIVAYNKKNHLPAFQNAIIQAVLPVHF